MAIHMVRATCIRQKTLLWNNVVSVADPLNALENSLVGVGCPDLASLREPVVSALRRGIGSIEELHEQLKASRFAKQATARDRVKKRGA